MSAWPPMMSLRPVVLLTAIVLGSLGGGYAFEIDWDKTAKFSGGVVAALAIHEGSHYLVAKAKGIDIDFHGLGWDSDEYSTTLQLAGLMGDALSSEIVLRIPAERRGPFEDGLLVWNILEELTYPTLRYDSGDLGNLRVTPSEKRLYAILFISHALHTAYRMDRDERLSPRLWIGKMGGAPAAGYTWNW